MRTAAEARAPVADPPAAWEAEIRAAVADLRRALDALRAATEGAKDAPEARPPEKARAGGRSA